MTDNATDGASAPAAQEPALKSTDTSDRPAVEAPEPKQEAPKTEAPAATPQEPEGDEGADDAPAADSPDKGKRKERLPRWVKERLERERLVTEQRTREAVMREIDDRQKPAQPPAEPEREKTLADFDFDQEAHTAYLVDRAIQKREASAAREAQEREQAEAAEKFKAKIDAFEERVGDGSWEDIVSSPINTDPKFKPLCDLFMGDDHDLDIALELASDVAEAERLLSLSPLARVRELAKLAEKFSGAPTPEKPEKAPVLPKKLTNAPPPPKTVAGAGKATVDDNDPNLSTAERIALWKKRGK